LKIRFQVNCLQHTTQQSNVYVGQALIKNVVLKFQFLTF